MLLMGTMKGGGMSFVCAAAPIARRRLLCRGWAFVLSFVAVLVCCLSLASPGAASTLPWQEVAWPLSSSAPDVRALEFVDTSIGWRVGTDGLVMRTQNGGTDWVTVDSGTTTPLTDVDFVDRKRGWTVGYEGTILATSDGGRSWEAQASGTGVDLNSVCFVDARYGWAVGGDRRYGRADGVVLRTQDGGRTWVQSTAEVKGLRLPLWSVSFSDRSHGLCAGGGEYSDDDVTGSGAYVLRTTDGGRTWTTAHAYPRLTFPFDCMTVACVDPEFAWFALPDFEDDTQRLWRSSDGGETWRAVPEGYEDMPDQSTAVSFLGRDHVWTSAGDRSTDGGLTWEHFEAPPGWRPALCFVTPDVGWWAGQTWEIGADHRIIESSRREAIFRTADGGRTWEEQWSAAPEPPWGPVSDLEFTGPRTGWATTARDSSTLRSAGRLRRTDDGGRTWRSVWAGTALHDVDFGDAAHGCAVGDGGVALVTGDGGDTWARATSLWCDLFAVDFVDESHAWIVGDRGSFSYVFATEDSGRSWQMRTYLYMAHMRDVAFLNEQRGWAVARGAIVWTDDGGYSWSWYTALPVTGARALDFVDPLNGWVVGGGGRILHTSDGGATWAWQDSGVEVTLNDVRFLTPEIGWAVGDDGTVLTTRDGGATWVVEETGTSADLFAVDGVNPAKAWAGGETLLIRHPAR